MGNVVGFKDDSAVFTLLSFVYHVTEAYDKDSMSAVGTTALLIIPFLHLGVS